MQGSWVQSLFRELDSTCHIVRPKKKKNSQKKLAMKGTSRMAEWGACQPTLWRVILMLRPDTKYNILHKQAQGASVNISTLKLATDKKGLYAANGGLSQKFKKTKTKPKTKNINIVHQVSRIKDKNTSPPQQDISIQQSPTLFHIKTFQFSRKRLWRCRRDFVDVLWRTSTKLTHSEYCQAL